MPRRIVWIFTIAAAVVAAAMGGPLQAEEARPGALNLSRLSDVQLDQRIAFIEQRLDRERNGAMWWQWGWTGFHIASAAYSAATIATSDDRKDRRTAIVDGVQAAAAATYQIIAPHAAWRGGDPVREMPSATRADREAQLAAAEQRLSDSAEAAETPYRILPHALNVATNLIAGGIIWAIADRAHAARSAGAGLIIGEAEIWTSPSYGSVDFSDYSARFGGTAGLHADDARPLGLAMTVQF
jgi:hypothetical protein